MKARCLETRLTPEGYRRRRYELDGVRFTTLEVPIEQVEAWVGIKPRALALIKEGWKPAAIAHELGLGIRTVQRWKHDSE